MYTNFTKYWKIAFPAVCTFCSPMTASQHICQNLIVVYCYICVNLMSGKWYLIALNCILLIVGQYNYLFPCFLFWSFRFPILWLVSVLILHLFKTLIVKIIFYTFSLILFCLSAPGISCSTWDLGSLTRDWIQVSCIGRTVSQPLDHQGSPMSIIFINFRN